MTFLIIFLHSVLILYNDFFQSSDEHGITTRSSLYVFGNTETEDIHLLLLTIEIHSSRPIILPLGMWRNEKLLQKIHLEENKSLTTTPSNKVDQEISKLVCNKRSFWGNFRAVYRMVLLSNGSVAMLDNNVTDQKISLEYILNNSQYKFIGQESNVEWMPLCDNSGISSIGSNVSVSIKSGFIDNLQIYGIYLHRDF